MNTKTGCLRAIIKFMTDVPTPTNTDAYQTYCRIYSDEVPMADWKVERNYGPPFYVVGRKMRLSG